MARYQPSSHPFGVCFSGGGLRSFAATMGQMRGLWALGLLDEVGAVSAVSGAAWFNTIFSYAPTDIPDRTLLGPIRHPGEITPQNLAELDPHCIAAPLPELTTNNLTMTHTDFLLGAAYTQPRALNRVYARLLNERLLKSFRLDDPQTFFSLDAESVEQIITRNPALKSTDFYTMRPNHPYLIVGSIPDRWINAYQPSRW
jgi:hypothetical protein